MSSCQQRGSRGQHERHEEEPCFDGSEIRVLVNGLEFFSPETILKQKIKVNRGTGKTVKIVLKDLDRNVFALNLKKNVLKIARKDISPERFDPGDGPVDLKIEYTALRAGIDLPVTLPGKTANRLLLEPPAAGEFRPAPEINPRND